MTKIKWKISSKQILKILEWDHSDQNRFLVLRNFQKEYQKIMSQKQKAKKIIIKIKIKKKKILIII